MKVSITTKAPIALTSLIGVSAQPMNPNWGNNPSWSMSGQNGQQRANPYGTAKSTGCTMAGATQPPKSAKYGHDQRYGYKNRKSIQQRHQQPEPQVLSRVVNCLRNIIAVIEGNATSLSIGTTIAAYTNHRSVCAGITLTGLYILATIATGIIYNIIYGS